MERQYGNLRGELDELLAAHPGAAQAVVRAVRDSVAAFARFEQLVADHERGLPTPEACLAFDRAWRELARAADAVLRIGQAHRGVYFGPRWPDVARQVEQVRVIATIADAPLARRRTGAPVDRRASALDLAVVDALHGAGVPLTLSRSGILARTLRAVRARTLGPIADPLTPYVRARVRTWRAGRTPGRWINSPRRSST